MPSYFLKNKLHVYKQTSKRIDKFTNKYLDLNVKILFSCFFNYKLSKQFKSNIEPDIFKFQNEIDIPYCREFDILNIWNFKEIFYFRANMIFTTVSRWFFPQTETAKKFKVLKFKKSAKRTSTWLVV